jgi:hypothetical protein
MIYQTHLSLPDGKYAILYRFPRKGDGLPMHRHEGETANLQHAVLCTQGRIALYGPNKAPYVELAAGEDLWFDSSLPHEICALQDGSHVLNVFKHGRPEGYDKLPANELDSSVAMRPLTEGIE